MIPTTNTEGCKAYASTHTLPNYSHMEIRSQEENIEEHILRLIDCNMSYNGRLVRCTITSMNEMEEHYGGGGDGYGNGVD